MIPDLSCTARTTRNVRNTPNTHNARIFEEAMRLRQLAHRQHNRSLGDTYLLIASACEFNTLSQNALQLCNLLFLNMLLGEAKRMCTTRQKGHKRYFALRKKEKKLRVLLYAKV